MSNEEESKKILMLMQHRGFLWGPSPEIYNPIKGSFEYGPLGKELKNRIEIYCCQHCYCHTYSSIWYKQHEPES